MLKTIKINPELFKVNYSGTRKKKVNASESKIKSDKLLQKENNVTLAKRKNILKFIRRHQDENINEKNTSNVKETINTSNDFDESMKYLMDMTDDNNEKTIHNNTPTTLNSTLKKNNNLSSITNNSLSPKYGCLKHGSLPTYRELYKNCDDDGDCNQTKQ